MAIVPLVGLIPALRERSGSPPARGRGAGGSGRPDPAGGDTQDVTEPGPGPPAPQPHVVTVAEEPLHAPSDGRRRRQENREELRAIARTSGP